MKIVNLARRPFENLRPVKRATLALWLLAVFLLAIDLWLYWGHLTGSSTTRDRLAEVRAAIARENAELDRLEAAFTALELDEQNAIVATLNDLIDKRTFPWGLLFDRLETVLPDDARLESVRPQGQELDIKERRRSRAERRGQRGAARAARVEDEGPEGIRVDLSGTAETEVAIEDLIDNFWDDPAFDQPSLKNKRRSQTGGWDFNLDVIFLTAVVRAQASGDSAVTAVEEGAGIGAGGQTDTAVLREETGDPEVTAGARAPAAPAAGRARAGAVVSSRPGDGESTAAGARRGPSRDWRRATRPGRTAAAPAETSPGGEAAGAAGTVGTPVAAAPPATGTPPGAPRLPPAVLLPTAGQPTSPGTTPPPPTATTPTTTPAPRPTPARPTPTSTPPPSPRTRPGPPPPDAPPAVGDDDRPVSSAGDASSTARLAGGGSGFAPGAPS